MMPDVTVSVSAHVQQCLQTQNEATLKSKLKVDRRNLDLHRRHDALKEDAQHTQRALAASQVHSAPPGHCMHYLDDLQTFQVCKQNDNYCRSCFVMK